MTDEPSTIDLGSEAETDWMSPGSVDPTEMEPAEAVYELSYGAAKRLLQGTEETAPDRETVNAVHSEFTETVNMSAAELREWADHECSNNAGVKPREIRQRLLALLETPPSEWGRQEIHDAKRVVSFVPSLRELPQDDTGGDCPSDRDITLLNWGYRPDSAAETL
jgi:hypothetical protein